MRRRFSIGIKERCHHREFVSKELALSTARHGENQRLQSCEIGDYANTCTVVQVSRVAYPPKETNDSAIVNFKNGINLLSERMILRRLQRNKRGDLGRYELATSADMTCCNWVSYDPLSVSLTALVMKSFLVEVRSSSSHPKAHA